MAAAPVWPSKKTYGSIPINYIEYMTFGIRSGSAGYYYSNIELSVKVKFSLAFSVII